VSDSFFSLKPHALQRLIPFSVAPYVPCGHGSQDLDADSFDDRVPREQEEHVDAPPVAEKVPSGQGEHEGSVLCNSAENVPGSHLMQELAAWYGWYSPARHASQ
jgi:hypothetical protein